MSRAGIAERMHVDAKHENMQHFSNTSTRCKSAQQYYNNENVYDLSIGSVSSDLE